MFTEAVHSLGQPVAVVRGLLAVPAALFDHLLERDHPLGHVQETGLEWRPLVGLDLLSDAAHFRVNDLFVEDPLLIVLLAKSVEILLPLQRRFLHFQQITKLVLWAALTDTFQFCNK